MITLTCILFDRLSDNLVYYLLVIISAILPNQNCSAFDVSYWYVYISDVLFAIQILSN